MDWVADLALFFGLLVAMMLSGMPVAFGFITLNIIGLYLYLGIGSLSLLATSSFSSIGQFSLIPIPLFILMGELLLRTGLAGKTVEAVDQWIGRLPGRLSLSSVGGGTLFGALSGASMASVAMLGSTLVPEMAKRGYKPEMSVSSILAGGGLAVLIPPSALGVLLGALAKSVHRGAFACRYSAGAPAGHALFHLLLCAGQAATALWPHPTTRPAQQLVTSFTRC